MSIGEARDRLAYVAGKMREAKFIHTDLASRIFASREMLIDLVPSASSRDELATAVQCLTQYFEASRELEAPLAMALEHVETYLASS